MCLLFSDSNKFRFTKLDKHKKYGLYLAQILASQLGQNTFLSNILLFLKIFELLSLIFTNFFAKKT